MDSKGEYFTVALHRSGLGRYRGYSKLRTHTAVGPYGRYLPRKIGPF